MFKSKQARWAIAAALLALTGTALADMVTLNGTTYVCQNTCQVTTMPNGGWLLQDSEGGWIHEYNEDQDGPLE